MNAHEDYAALPRPVESVPLPGGGTVHVRDLTIAELRGIDTRADALPERDRGLAWTLRLVAAALVYADGKPVFETPADPAADAEQVAEVERWFTPSQLRAIAEAAAPTREDAKKN